jgi:hypothetical protein
MKGPLNSEARATDWVVSPPLAPEGPAIDFAHLERMTLGEREVELEVLALFRQQLVDLLGRLEKLPREGVSLAHTLKGIGSSGACVPGSRWMRKSPTCVCSSATR